ncbi:MAG TPA: hypothetical protein VMN79_05470 [Casimicrobiaceae bacterium]|nr:hypothetical protein [Casimicrobiaceae bacterium]
MLLNTMPLWLSALIVVGLPTLVAMAGPSLVRRRVRLDTLSINNEVAGFKFATVGVLYAVLLAFAVILVWEHFSDAEANVAREAGASATIYRLSDGLDGEARGTVRKNLTAYMEAAIAEEWPAMEKGGESAAVTRALDNLYAASLSYRPGDQRGFAILSAILHQLDEVTEARRARLLKATGIVPTIVWVVLCTGALITVGFTFFFGTRNLRAQSLMTGGLALLVSSALLVVVAIDHPFSGSVKVGPEPLVEVLHDFAGARASTR